MKTIARWQIISIVLLAAAIIPQSSIASTAAEIDRDVDSALQKLYRTSFSARELSKVAKGILVFPRVVEGSFIVGAQYGKGALRQGESSMGYYNTVAASVGLQAGAKSFGYALFFMTDSAINYLNDTGGLEIGVGPSVVIVDKGLAGSLSTSTAKDDIYAFFFDQQGLMAGISLQGSKITRIIPDN